MVNIFLRQLLIILCGLFVVKTSTATLQLPSPSTTRDHNYQMVFVNYSEAKVPQDIQEKLAADFVKAMGEMGLSAISVDSMKSLQLNFKTLHDKLAASLQAVNASLPVNQAWALNLLYLPLHKDSLIVQSGRLQAVSTQGTLAPLSTILKSLALRSENLMGDAEFEWYTSVSNSLAQHNHEMSQVSDGPGLYFSALQLQLSLQKDRSQMQVQILAGLNEQTKTMEQSNEQVRIQSLQVRGFSELLDQNAGVPMAEAPGYFSQAPMLVMSTQFDQNNPEAPLELSLSLGAFNGLGTSWNGLAVLDSFALAGTATPSEVGAEQWLQECQMRMQSVPSLQGLLAKGAVGGGSLGELVEKADVGLAFHFFDVWFQFNDKGEPYIPPGRLDVRVAVAGSLGGFTECMAMGQVNEQLSDEVNTTIRAQLEELLRVESLANDLLDQF